MALIRVCVVPKCSQRLSQPIYPVDCDCLCHLLDTHYCCLCLNGSLKALNPPLASHPLMHAICDITVAVKKVI